MLIYYLTKSFFCLTAVYLSAIALQNVEPILYGWLCATALNVMWFTYPNYDKRLPCWLVGDFGVFWSIRYLFKELKKQTRNNNKLVKMTCFMSVLICLPFFLVYILIKRCFIIKNANS